MQLNAYLFDIRVSPPPSPLIRFFLDERHLAYITWNVAIKRIFSWEFYATTLYDRCCDIFFGKISLTLYGIPEVKLRGSGFSS